MKDDPKSVYARTWDYYVSDVFPKIKEGEPHRKAKLKSWQVLNTADDQYTWPGDEWGDSAAVEKILQTCVFDNLESVPNCICEIGGGSGRYTEVVFRRFPNLRIFAFDVSQLFLQQLNERLEKEAHEGQLQAHLLTAEPRLIYDVLEGSGVVGQVDVLYSFDAMVHVELHTLLIYVATAAAVLRQGGILAMNVADATRDFGFQKLVSNSPGVYGRGGEAGSHFQFMSPEIVSILLSRFGFSFEFHDCNGRDLFFTARLTAPKSARMQFEEAGSSWWLSR